MLFLHAGKFKLLSLDNIFKYENTPVASIRINTNDNRALQYTNSETASYFRKRYQLIPVHISDVQFYPKDPDAAVDIIVNHSIASYNTKDKLFNLYNNNGSVVNLKKTFNTAISHLPASTTKEADVDKTNLTIANKNQKVIYDNSNNSELVIYSTDKNVSEYHIKLENGLQKNDKIIFVDDLKDDIKKEYLKQINND